MLKESLIDEIKMVMKTYKWSILCSTVNFGKLYPPPPVQGFLSQFYFQRVQIYANLFHFWFNAKWLVSLDSLLLIRWWSSMQYFILTTLSELLKTIVYSIGYNNETLLFIFAMLHSFSNVSTYVLFKQSFSFLKLLTVLNLEVDFTYVHELPKNKLLLFYSNWRKQLSGGNQTENQFLNIVLLIARFFFTNDQYYVVLFYSNWRKQLSGANQTEI